MVIENSRGGRDVVHWKRPTDVDITLDFAYFGDVQIDLIHQSNDAPSCYKEFLDAVVKGCIISPSGRMTWTPLSDIWSRMDSSK
ncbi:hypothetical protein [Rhizobium sp. BK456]|uniref:hypothetical protein n=1 Tax=Rhizobium sp. BK456 TaxID=2587007 RepID=UPI001619FED5|nr:hypothetical protein [Rhizobium sp. BK456]MBB3527030.1 hypothetical protein [Rhizobium sp. BK456]